MKNQKILKLISDDRTSPYALPILAIVLTLVTSSIILLIMGKNPAGAMAAFLRGSGFLPRPSYAGGQNMFTDFLQFLGILAPMLLGALAIVIALKTGMFNIGVSGQMLAAGFIATVFVGYTSLPAGIARPLVILIGILAGAALGALAGWLKYRFNIHEVVSTIMFNYMISYITGFFINNYYPDTITRTSKVCSAAARLTLTGITLGKLRLTIPLGIFIAIAAVFIIRYILNRMTLGFELKAVGLNRDAAMYAGIREGRAMVTGMTISGVLAGLAGVTYYLGYYNTIVPKTLAPLGYDAIAVAMLGNLSPAGAVFASILVTVFQKGSVYMSSSARVPQEISQVIIGILLLFCACGAYFKYRAKRFLSSN